MIIASPPLKRGARLLTLNRHGIAHPCRAAFSGERNFLLGLRKLAKLQPGGHLRWRR